MSCPDACPSQFPYRVGWAPCCREDTGAVASLAGFWTAGQRAAYPVELETLLLETGKARYRATGGCMAPGVQPGDILRVAPKKAGQVEIGEIAVVRRDGRLIGHRTVARGEDERGHYIVTRSDRAASETDAPSRDDDIVGVVVSVERNGRAVPEAQDGQRLRPVGRLLAAPRGLQSGIRTRVTSGLSRLQRSRAYRLIARRWQARQRDQIQCVVRLPFAANPGLPFLQKLRGEEIAGLDLRSGRVQRWAIDAMISGRQAASLGFILRPPGCPYAGWWLAEVKTRIRYRGAGLEEELLRRAERILGRSGVSCLRAGPPGYSDAERWCRTLGFEPREGDVFACGKPGLLPAVVLSRVLREEG